MFEVGGWTRFAGRRRRRPARMDRRHHRHRLHRHARLGSRPRRSEGQPLRIGRHRPELVAPSQWPPAPEQRPHRLRANRRHRHRTDAAGVSAWVLTRVNAAVASDTTGAFGTYLATSEESFLRMCDRIVHCPLVVLGRAKHRRHVVRPASAVTGSRDGPARSSPSRWPESSRAAGGRRWRRASALYRADRSEGILNEPRSFPTPSPLNI